MFRLGSTARPNPVGGHDPVFAGGWSAADQAGFAWIEGAAAELEFDLPPVLSDLALEIDCFPMDLSGPSPQRLTVFCNGAHVGTHLVLSRGHIAVTIPRDLCAARRLRLSLVPAVVEIPKLAGRNSDERALSVGVYSVSLLPAKKASAA